MQGLHGFESHSPATQKEGQPKPLRFVTSYGAPHPKRRRIGAACLTCRKRKTACSGERPTCETCVQNRLLCSGYAEGGVPAPTRAESDATSATPSGRYGGQTVQSLKRRHSPTERNAHGRQEVLDLSQSPRIVETRPSVSNPIQAPEPLFDGPRNRMPYFRWLGPTAIMPGFKQMVVKVKRQDTDPAHSSTDGTVLPSPALNPEHRIPSIYSTTPAAVESDIRTPLSLPFYDTSPMPPSELITHLVNTFFTHLGCNYPFLQRERFLRDLEEKQVDAILVDAVCALAARFSTHTLLTQQFTNNGEKPSPAEYGHAFAQRAKTALTDTFPCPSVAAAQAALLLAYNEFGEQRDSGLWVYLGIAIRLAQDLGLHKDEGLKYVGKVGPTPRMVKQESRSSNGSAEIPAIFDHLGKPESARRPSGDHKDVGEQRAVEQERVDTFWAIFFLDRVVSSGTGRRSTLRDSDIELAFPSPSERIPNSDWPAPFPALIRIIHLYGRVADQLNSIKEPSDITPETPRRLAAMEHQVTSFYQGLSPRLHFDAVNFQHYMKAGEGTNFVLLHFWFHTLIVLLHQPTLLKAFEKNLLQLFPNSQQLSMSSAKTIADILSYSQLMDAKASLGNPFTSQPIYIAACAFHRETAERTACSVAQSRAASPSRSKDASSESNPSTTTVTPVHQPSRRTSISALLTPPDPVPGRKPLPASAAPPDPKSQLAKHTLLATAASQHYQLCYKALQSLETYWAGTKYILTVLEQKSSGIADPLLYTAEEGESSLERPRPEPAFTSPGWRRKLSWGPGVAGGVGLKGAGPSQAIGWTLTGTMNSPSTNLAWHYASGGVGGTHETPRDPRLDPGPSPWHLDGCGPGHANGRPNHARTASAATPHPPHPPPFQSADDRLARRLNHSGGPVPPVPTSHPAGGVLNFDTRFDRPPPANSVQQTSSAHSRALSAPMTSGVAPASHTRDLNGSGSGLQQHYPHPAVTAAGFLPPGQEGVPGLDFWAGDLLIETQEDVEMSLLGLEMMPWFDSWAGQGMGLFEGGHSGGGGDGGG